MKTSQHGVDLVKRFEGFVPHAYKDAAGHATIGYGHLIRTGEVFGTLSPAEGEKLLRSDLRDAEQGVLRYTDIDLTQQQFDALVSFVYNLGAGHYATSTLRRRVNAGDHELVPAELTRWVRAGGKPLLGLARRRVAESELYLT